MKAEYDLSKLKARKNPYASKLKKPVTMRLSEGLSLVERSRPCVHAGAKGSIRTTARAPTALAKRFTVRLDGVPLPPSMRATTLWVVPMRAATTPGVRPACVRAATLQQWPSPTSLFVAQNRFDVICL